MKKLQYLIYTLILIILINISKVSAETIVYIDMNKIMQVSKAGKSVTDQLNKTNENNIKKFTKIEADLKKDEKSLIAQRNVLSQEEFEKSLQNLKNKIDEYRKKRQKAIEEVTQKRIKASADFAQKIKPILAEYAKDKNIDMVIQKKNIIMGKTDLDITNQILKIVDQKISKLDIN